MTDPAGLWPGAELSDSFPPVTRPPVGWIEQDDGRVAVGAAVPLGMLSARVAEYLAAIEAPLVVTPWRSVLVCDLDGSVADTALRVLAPLGLVSTKTRPGWRSAPASAARAARIRSPMCAPTPRNHYVPIPMCTDTSSAANAAAAARRPVRCWSPPKTDTDQ